MRRLITALILLCACGSTTVAQTTAAPPATPTPAQESPKPAPPVAKNDYSNGDNWLCRPGRQDACDADLSATVISADGKMTLETWAANPNAPIDCFYVYPTVSRDPGANATMAIEPEEQRVVAQQFARLGSKCRLFAPMYRQVTLTALVARMAGRPMTADRDLAYNDVAAAWRHYLEHDNHGRGVVLIGHSQGSGVLARLIAQEIDGKPQQRLLVSAILMGTSLQVPPGKDGGGAFKTIPLCHSSSEVGCAIAFASFRASLPPPPTSFFGQGDKAAGTVAACVNPAALGGGSGELKAFMPAKTPLIAEASNTQPSWTSPPQEIGTPFVELPGLLTGQCVDDEHGNYLAVTVHPTAGAKRVNDIVGDVVLGGQVQRDWGLHLVDANLTMGNLVDVVGEQSATWLARGGR
jgi:pimeloyl-ACP methyl ester carboxylesterase